MDHADAHLGVLDLLQLGDRRLDRALHVALEDEVQVLDGAGLQLREELLERRARLRGRRQLLPPEALAAHLRALARVALVLDDATELAGGRRLVEAEDLDRLARPRLLELLAAEVVERADPAPGVAGDDRVADLERAALDEHRRDRAAADVEPGLDDRPRGLDARVRGQLELGVGDQQHLLEQVVEVLLLLRRDVGELGRPTPLLGLEPLGGEVAAHPVRVRVGDVDLVDGDDDRDLGRARVRDRLARLRHDAVVGGDDQDGDVRDLRAAGAHGGERLVARGVQEGQLPAVVLDLVRADVLRDAAGLGLDDRGLADRVEQRRLPVVDVAHDRDDRRARLERLLGVVEGLGLVVLLVAACLIVTSRLTLGSAAISPTASSESDWVIVTISPSFIMILMIDATGIAERVRELLDGDPGLDGDRPGRDDDLARLLRLPVGAVARLARIGTRPIGLRVDDHAALAPAASRRLAGPNRPVGAVLSLFVSHGQCSSVEA